MNEDLRKWFRQKWVRMNTKGEIIGPCGGKDDSEGKPKCLSGSKARSMTKKDRATATRRKRREDPNADRKGKPIMVNTEEFMVEGNEPTNPSLWSKAKSLAKQKFDVYPSAYANGWAAKYYKSKGGGWRSVSEETVDEACWKGYKRVGMKKKGDRMVPNCVPEATDIIAKAKAAVAKKAGAKLKMDPDTGTPDHFTAAQRRKKGLDEQSSDTFPWHEDPKNPTRKVGERKDKYGNPVKNVARYLAKKAMKANEEVEDLDETAKIVAHLQKRYGDNIRKSHVRSAANDFGVDASKLARAVRTKLGKNMLDEEQIDELSVKKLDQYRTRARQDIIDADDNDDNRMADKRAGGYLDASRKIYKKLAKEEAELSEENVLIHAPSNKHHGKMARVFYKHDDGRVNVQLKHSSKKGDVSNFTLQPNQFTPTEVKEDAIRVGRVAHVQAYRADKAKKAGAKLQMDPDTGTPDHFTAAARRKKGLPEEVEGLDELKRETVRTYYNKAIAQGKPIADRMKVGGGDWSKDGSDTKTLKKRAAGVTMALKRRSGEVKMSEDAEQIDELSNKVLKSYIKGASNQAFSKGYSGGAMTVRGDMNRDSEEEKAGEKNVNSAIKRVSGINKAVNKLKTEAAIKEEVEGKVYSVHVKGDSKDHNSPEFKKHLKGWGGELHYASDKGAAYKFKKEYQASGFHHGVKSGFKSLDSEHDGQVKEELGKSNEWGTDALRQKYAAMTPGQEGLAAKKIPTFDPRYDGVPTEYCGGIKEALLSEISAKGAVARADFRAKIQKVLADPAAISKAKKTLAKKKAAEKAAEPVHLVMQLRKASSIGSKVQFRNGESHHVAPNHVEKFNDKYHSLKSSIEKESLINRAHKSHADFFKAIAEETLDITQQGGGPQYDTHRGNGGHMQTLELDGDEMIFADFDEKDMEELEAEVDNMTWEDIVDEYDDEELEYVDGEEEIEEGVTPQGRLKKKFSAMRNKTRRNMARNLALKRVSTPDRIKARSISTARRMVYQRFLRGRDKSSMSAAEKTRIEAQVKRLAPSVARLSVRIVGQVRKLEQSRMKNRTKGKKR